MLKVDGLAAAGAVEIDDVECARASGDPPPGSLERIGVINGLRVEVALRQPHGLAVEDVDRRQEDHAPAEAVVAACAACPPHMRTKLPSIRRPCAEDFSG